MKYTQKEVYDIYMLEGYCLLDKYKDIYSYNILEKDGYLFRVYLKNWLSGYRPNIVDKRNPYSINNINNFMKINKIQSVLLSTKYENQKNPLEFKCCCGNIYTSTWTHFKNKHNWVCPQCALKKRIEKNKKDINEVKQKILDKGFIPCFDKYINNNTPLKIMNKDGYYLNILISNIDKIKGVDIFNKKNPYTLYNIRHYLVLNKIKANLLSNEYNGVNNKLLWECECGNKFETSLESFINGKFRCSICSKKTSKIELMVENWLKRDNVFFKREYKISDCKNKRELPFDFMIKINNELRLIEVDGIFHYSPQQYKDGIKNFQNQKIRDGIKNRYCKNNNIKLLRIPYWEFRNDNYKKILNDFIKD